MPRPDKVAVVEQVREDLTGSAAALLTEYRGLSVAEQQQLRADLRSVGARYRVAKNTLIRRAAKDAGLPIPDEVLTGPTALTFAEEDPVAAAKALKRFAKDHPGLVIKGGLLDGGFLDAGQAQGLADLATREELLAQVAGMLTAVLAQPARLAQANLSKAARLFAALQAKTDEDAG